VADDRPPELATFGPIVDSVVRELVDRAQIEHIVLHWSHEVDLLRPARAAEFFTEDCVVDYGPRAPKGVLHGRSAYVAMMEEAQSTAAITERSTITARATYCSHHVSQVSVTFLSADSAASSAACFSLVGEPGGAHHVTFGVFQDSFVRTADGWRITARTQRPLGRAALDGTNTALDRGGAG
jgi:hypothetical protein